MSTTVYRVAGMTCEHCAAAVTGELSALDGVRTVTVDLAPTGASRVTVTSDRPLRSADVAAAVDEAGYSLVQP